MTADLKSKKHLPALDGVRGLAVLIVVAYHTGGGAQSANPLLRTIGLALKVGWSGVTLFFLLSGFLITGILWDSKGASHWWRNFYMRRILRISPLYYASLLLIVAAALVLHQRNGCAGLWVYALYLQDLPWVVDAGAALRPLPLSHFWSLAVEEQFYLVWPFLIWRLRTMSQVKYLCLAVFLLSAVFRFVVWRWSAMPEAYEGFLLSRAGELALGGYLAMCFRDGSWGGLQRAAPYITAGSLLSFLAVVIPRNSYELTNAVCDVWGLLTLSLFFAGMIVLSLRGGVVQRAMSAGWIRWVGSISYGVYVFHILLQPLFDWVAARLATPVDRAEAIVVRGVITWVLTLVIAWLSFRYFESPILSLRRHFQNRARGE